MGGTNAARKRHVKAVYWQQYAVRPAEHVDVDKGRGWIRAIRRKENHLKPMHQSTTIEPMSASALLECIKKNPGAPIIEKGHREVWFFRRFATC
jgi:hypothetical protein